MNDEKPDWVMLALILTGVIATVIWGIYIIAAT